LAELREADKHRIVIRTPDLSLMAAFCLTSELLQVALRHPLNNGPSADVVRRFIDQVLQSMCAAGFHATAEAVMLGFDPAYDEPDRLPAHKGNLRKGSL
jgi:hypothetical protein